MNTNDDINYEWDLSKEEETVAEIVEETVAEVTVEETPAAEEASEETEA